LKQGLLIWLLGCCLLGGCTSGKAVNALFDMGPAGSATVPGYTRVSQTDDYQAAKGYGWLVKPTGSFDSMYNKLPDSLLKDGVTGVDSLVFRADVADGDYFITVVTGHHGADKMMAHIAVNGEVIADSVGTPWFRLPFKSIRKKVHITDNKAIIRVGSIGARAVGIFSIELRPVTAMQDIPFTDKSPEQDTAVAAKFEHQLVQVIGNSSNPEAAINQLHSLRQYLQACGYYNGGGWGWATRKTGMNQIQRMYTAADLLEQVVADQADPLYYKALYLLARIHYWLYQEDEDLYPDSKATVYFTELAKVFPKHEVLQMYLGKQVADTFIPGDTTGAPRWAVLQHEAMSRMLKLIHWWVEQRQAANGELGGKFGDDVEMLRWWLPAVVGADDSIARKGYTRLADGIWNSDLLYRGYSKGVDDVEHSAELFRDSHPGMFMIRYGDPAYIERCMISMQHFRDVWSGITPGGHRHFKSYYLSATEAWEHAPYGVDVPLNARALLPGLWTAWYNNNPTLLRLFTEWSNAWVADAAATKDGKPAGVFPAAVHFGDESFGEEWYAPRLKYDYYDWDHLGHVGELYYHLTGMYYLTGQRHLLDPVNHAARLITEASQHAPAADAPKGSAEWVKKILLQGGEDKTAGTHPLGQVFAMTRQLTGQTGYDELVSKLASPYNQYTLTGNVANLLEGFTPILASLRYNFPLLTREVKFTDRVYVRGSDLLTGMYTGHFGRGFEFPSLVATWKNTGPGVSVFVRRGDERSAVVSLFNRGEARTIEMNSWRLTPGEYRLTIGTDRNDDGKAEEILTEQRIQITERIGRIAIPLPAQKLVVLQLQQLRADGQALTQIADPGISEKDITIGHQQLEAGDVGDILCTVHNIGGVAARHVTVTLLVDGKLTDRHIIPLIEAPNDLEPRTQVVRLQWKAREGKHQLTVRLSYPGKEITTINNEASIGIGIPYWPSNDHR
jgi:hypothetical protein